MEARLITPLSSLTEGSESAQLREEIGQLREQIADLKRQLDWFKRQLFGQKSERRGVDPPPEQLSLGEGWTREPETPVPEQPIPAHSRRRAVKPADGDEASGRLFFDPAKVPVEVIPVPNPEIEGLTGDPYAVIGEKVSDRLAQRPGSHVILKYVRAVSSGETPKPCPVRRPRWGSWSTAGRT